MSVCNVFTVWCVCSVVCLYEVSLMWSVGVVHGVGVECVHNKVCVWLLLFELHELCSVCLGSGVCLCETCAP